MTGLHSNLTEGRAIERVCLPCSDDLFACGLYEWWARKRPEVFDQLDKATRAKPDCKNGRACFRQGNAAHSRKFNHIWSVTLDLFLSSEAVKADRSSLLYRLQLPSCKPRPALILPVL